MSLINALMGNASAVDIAELEAELKPILADTESLALAYKVVRDMFIFTNKRLILIDKQGMTGKKVSYQSIPYKAITFFEVETAGRFDLDAELKLWISGQKEPLVKELKRGTDVVEIQRTIANFVL
ncbi:PH domain-containing protein [Shewanella sp. NIFS-20-20]|uniref:PH domain-containing protein n=1 Tax=Shewanella sp. NIFS-20-20 TaxID=2853806 RepID=UPI001C46E757|nr:PH domain-containing protein [Shewanella sp. NIFS-20-20]MBV7316992.1 PH domain-containing protein [Shewanella sp. NIFS-20-20]